MANREYYLPYIMDINHKYNTYQYHFLCYKKDKYNIAYQIERIWFVIPGSEFKDNHVTTLKEYVTKHTDALDAALLPYQLSGDNLKFITNQKMAFKMLCSIDRKYHDSIGFIHIKNLGDTWVVTEVH